MPTVRVFIGRAGRYDRRIFALFVDGGVAMTPLTPSAKWDAGAEGKLPVCACAIPPKLPKDIQSRTTSRNRFRFILAGTRRRLNFKGATMAIEPAIATATYSVNNLDICWQTRIKNRNYLLILSGALSQGKRRHCARAS
jgi:hypothetical protein